MRKGALGKIERISFYLLFLAILTTYFITFQHNFPLIVAQTPTCGKTGDPCGDPFTPPCCPGYYCDKTTYTCQPETTTTSTTSTTTIPSQECPSGTFFKKFGFFVRIVAPFAI